MQENSSVSVQDGNPISNWQPRWLVDGDGTLGITSDDHCLVVLVLNEVGQWRPTQHIPEDAIALIVDLANKGLDI